MTPTVPERQLVHNAVMVACRAPSLHNSQPWRWVADGAELHLFADHKRLVQVADRSGREQLLSCGAVGLATCTLTHMTEVSPSRDIIRQITGQDGLPQLLIRVGRTPAIEQQVPVTPRRPVSEVLEFRS